MNNVTVEVDQSNSLAIFNADTARNLLKALANPRNSHIELFKKPVQVSMKDIEELTKRVANKLGQLRVDSQCTIMKTLVSLDKDRNFQLIGWQQVKSFDWKIPEKTNAVVLAWEFMYKRDDIQSPELHVLSVRITEAMHPMQVLRAALSSDRDDAERLEIKMAPVVCEVDYVDGLLSRELVQLVGQWHEGLRRPAPLSDIGDFIQKRQVAICKSVDFSLEMLLPIAYISAIYIWMHQRLDQPLTTEFITYALLFIMIFTLVIKIANRFSSWMAQRLALNIERMGKFPIFELTNGDQNNLTAAISKITASTIKFWGGIGVSFVINVISAVFTFYVLGMK